MAIRRGNTIIAGSYNVVEGIPQATETVLGGIKAGVKASTDTQEVKIDTATGKLYVAPSSAISVDNTTITKDANDTITTVGVKDEKTTSANKFWTGTLAEYNALTTKDSNTFYNVTDELSTSGITVYSKDETDALLDDKQNLLTSANAGDNVTITGTTTPVINALSGLTATVTELNYTDGVTSNVQTQLDNKVNGAYTVWTGTKAQYDAIATKDANTLYNITDDSDITLSLLETIYPVGSIYITTNATCPLAALFGTWTLVGADRVLQGAGARGSVGTTLEESLPNIKGTFNMGDRRTHIEGTSGSLYNNTIESGQWGATSTATGNTQGVGFDASLSSSTYQDNAPVQQDAYLVNIFRRTA